MFVWISFLLAIVVLLSVGRRSIWVALFIAALIIGFFNITPFGVLQEFTSTISSIPVILLALSVGIIPLIGGSLEESGLTDGLVSNLRINRKWFVILAPALLGTLPMPGGALLSSPLLKKGAQNIKPETKVAINIWFRHIPLMIYPLADVLIAAKLAELNLYKAIAYILPWAFITALVGYFFFVRKVEGRIDGNAKVDRKAIYKPIFCIFLAPAIHLTLTSIFPDVIRELPLLIGISTSLIVTMAMGKVDAEKFYMILKKMKSWNFFLIIIAMFFFLNIFNRSESAPVIARIFTNKTIFVVVFAAFMAFVTGRVAVPVSILLPIYYAKFGIEAIDYLTFSIMFCSVFLGYMLSPVHPCVSVSMEYFDTNLKQHFQKLTLPIGLILLLLALFSFAFL